MRVGCESEARSGCDNNESCLSHLWLMELGGAKIEAPLEPLCSSLHGA